MRIYHIVYQTTNLVNGKIYVGKHSTKNIDDGYIGSGNLIKRSIKKYGRESFKVEHLFFGLTSNDAYFFEGTIVDLDFINREDTYNMTVGGNGFKSGKEHPCFGKQQSKEHKEKLSKTRKGKIITEEHKRKNSLKRSGVKLTEEHKRKISESHKGKTLSENQKAKFSMAGKSHSEDSKSKIGAKFKGTFYITNGIINKRIRDIKDIPDGFWKGYTKALQGF